LLIKGLEFDHAVILDADALDERTRPGNGAKNLYVAMTRPSRSLSVLSAHSRIRLAAPQL
jgi:DNA helicase-2/ATP-dependent DNA helicase PcrA